MNYADPDGKALDLWIAWYQFTKEPDAMKPAEKALTDLLDKQL